MKSILYGTTLAVSIMITLNTVKALEQNEYKKIAYEDKVKVQRGQTFNLTFDKNVVSADCAKGNAEPVAGGDIALGLRGVLGYDGANAFKIETGEKLRFDVLKNISHKKGTIIFWVKAENYSPGKTKKNNPQNCHKAYIYVLFKDKKDWVKFYFYQFHANEFAYFFWQNSYSQKLHNYKTCPINLSGIPQSKWFQIAATWDEKEIKTYLNGKFQCKVGLPLEVKKTLSMSPDPNQSYISIREGIFGPLDSKYGKDTIIDDISIFNFPMSDLMIKKQYMSALKTKREKEALNMDFSFNGIDDGTGEINKAEVKIDLSGLPEKFINLLKKKQLTAKYTLLNNDTNSETKGTWILDKIQDKRVLNIPLSGNYVFSLELETPDGAVQKASKKFEIPDLSFAGNKIGKEDYVPAPWEPVKLDKNNRVSIWNRTYFFNNNPLPYQIKVAGKDILLNAPEIIIETAKGIEKIKYKTENRNITNSKVIFTGTGTASSFNMQFKTTVEFDGLINCEFTINGSPEIMSMKTTWAVKPEFAKYFLSPLLSYDKKDEYEFPGNDWKCVRQFWVASEAGGFCWAPSSDANWVFEPGQKILKISRRKNGTFCEINMINRKVKLPPNTPYQLLFIATPTRPAPKELYSFHMADAQYYEYYKDIRNNKILASARGEGQTAFGEFTPDPVDFPKLAEKKEKNSMAIYNFATGLTDSSLTGRYFEKYWAIPGSHVYSMQFRHRNKESTTYTLSCCPFTTYSDFILTNIKKLFNHKYGDRVWAIYYDLCGIRPCSNELHGCSFKDKFGRKIARSTLLGLREHLMRTTKYCHKNDRKTIYHAQNVFNPMVHGFADYWYGGEQFTGLIRMNRFAYCDDISDDIYQSELNRRLLGSALLFLPELCFKNCLGDAADASTFSMFTQVLLQDMPFTTHCNRLWITKKIVKILSSYDLDNSIVRRYYEQNNIKSSNSNVRITYYSCPKNEYLIVLGNTTKKEQKSTIDISDIKAGNFDVKAEFAEKIIKVNNGKFDVKIPPGMFMLIGITQRLDTK